MAVINPYANLAGNGTPNRIHARAAHWGRSAATDFWYREQEAGTAADDLITNYGWTTTALSYTIGSAADLLTSADVGTPTITVFDAASDVLVSPLIFGDYVHAQMATSILGYAPTTLNLECFANFGTATANETGTGFGFSTGTGITVTNHVAFIFSNSANFAIRGTDGTGALTDTGAAVDNAYHLWRITATAGGTVEWFIDGSSQGTITLKTDMYPTGFSAGIVGAGTNRINLAWAHVWYA